MTQTETRETLADLTTATTKLAARLSAPGRESKRDAAAMARRKDAARALREVAKALRWLAARLDPPRQTAKRARKVKD